MPLSLSLSPSGVGGRNWGPPRPCCTPPSLRVYVIRSCACGLCFFSTLKCTNISANRDAGGRTTFYRVRDALDHHRGGAKSAFSTRCDGDVQHQPSTAGRGHERCPDPSSGGRSERRDSVPADEVFLVGSTARIASSIDTRRARPPLAAAARAAGSRQRLAGCRIGEYRTSGV